MSEKYKPVPIGVMPKKIYDEQVKVQRFNDVCGAISRYYNEGLEIDIAWVEEYNELIGEIREYENERERIRNKSKAN